MKKCNFCRILDSLLAIGLLVLFSPILLFIIILLRLTGEGEVFFLQSRVGRNGKIFKIIKFATMLKNSENIGTGTVTVKDDNRILPVGKVLRRTKLNEVPQLINILIGEMSFVGPRPQTSRCFEAFSQSEQKIIASVMPGLTGIGSIIFSAEEELLALTSEAEEIYDYEIMPYKALLESWFIQRRGTVMYFALVLMTIWKLIFKSNRHVFQVFPSLPKPTPKLRAKLLK